MTMQTARAGAATPRLDGENDDLVDTEGRPTRIGIVNLSKSTFGRHGARIREQDRMMSLIDKTYKPFADPPDPDLYVEIKPGTAGVLVHRVGAQTVTDTPIVTHPPRNSSDTAQNLADLQEKMGQAILEGFEIDSIFPPFQDAAKRAANGMWVLKGPLFDFQAYPDRPRRGQKSAATFKDEMQLHRIKQAERFPFMLESVDPRQIVWDETSVRNPAWVIHRYMMAKSAFTTKYPEWRASKTSKQNEWVVVDEYWSDTYRAVLGDDMFATYREEATGEKQNGVIKNIYGFIPFEIGFGPYGFAGGKPEEMTRSMLFFVEDELIEESRVASLKSWAMQLYGLPPFAAEDIAAFQNAMMQGPGAAVQVNVKPGEDIRKKAPFPLEMPRPPEWLDQYEADLASKIENRTVTSALTAGIHQPGTTSGIMSGIDVGQGKSILRPIVKKMNRHASRILNRCAYIHEFLIGEEISVWLDRAEGREMITLKHDSWKGAYHFNVDMEPVDPTRDDRRAMLGLNLFAQGLLDPWTVLQEYLRHPDASGVIKRIIKWRVMNSPRFAMLLEKIAAEEAGFDQMLLAMEAAEELGEGGAGPESLGDFEIDDIVGTGQTPDNPAGGEGDGTSLLADFPTRGSIQGGDIANGAINNRQTMGAIQ